MSKKHFKLIAEILKNNYENSEEYNKLITDFCFMCRGENSKFSIDKFKEAIMPQEILIK